MNAAQGLIAAAVAVLTVLLFLAILAIEPAGGLEAAVAANLAETGVANPVTAVLLDFRGYDTFLELAIVALALVGVGAVTVRETAPDALSNPVARAAGAALAPAIILFAGYLLWNGTSRPGGAFQAGAMLAGALVLLEATGDRPPFWRRGLALRLGAVAGTAAFLVAGLAALLAGGAFLDYPGADAAYATILAIEAAATLGVGVSLAALLAADPSARA